MYVSGERAVSSHIPAVSEAGASGVCCGVGRKPAGSAASACSVLTGPAQDTGTRSALPEMVLQSGQLCLAPWGFSASTVKTPGTFRRHFCVLGRRGLVLGCHPSGWCQDDDTLGEPSHCENCTAIRDFRGKEDTSWWDQVCALICVTSLRSFLAEKGGILLILSQRSSESTIRTSSHLLIARALISLHVCEAATQSTNPHFR